MGRPQQQTWFIRYLFGSVLLPGCTYFVWMFGAVLRLSKSFVQLVTVFHQRYESILRVQYVSQETVSVLLRSKSYFHPPPRLRKESPGRSSPAGLTSPRGRQPRGRGSPRKSLTEPRRGGSTEEVLGKNATLVTETKK